MENKTSTKTSNTIKEKWNKSRKYVYIFDMNKTVDLRNEIFICGFSFYTFGVAEKSAENQKNNKKKKENNVENPTKK